MFVISVSWSVSERPLVVPVAPLTTDVDKTALGERLFFDVRLSGSGHRSCNTCHDLGRGGVSHTMQPSTGGPHEGFDTPSVFNAALNYRLGWLAQYRTLEEINEQSILSPDIMGTDWTTVLSKLSTDPIYATGLGAAYGRSWGKDDVLNALAEFQRSLITPNSRFDRFLEGRTEVLTPTEKQGYLLFQGLGCVSCHQGRNVGGNLVQRFGIFGVSEQTRRPENGKTDLGRIAVTGLERDRFQFRVPSLRNVAVTAPYFHNGSVPTLDQAIVIMGRTQLGRELSQPDTEAIAQFLQTLTGEYKGVPLDQSYGDRVP
jgi:cytochrome c peroxidase